MDERKISEEHPQNGNLRTFPTTKIVFLDKVEQQRAA